MIMSLFHFFTIHWKMIFGNPSVIIYNMISKTLERLSFFETTPIGYVLELHPIG